MKRFTSQTFLWTSRTVSLSKSNTLISYERIDRNEGDRRPVALLHDSLTTWYFETQLPSGSPYEITNGATCILESRVGHG